MSTTTVSPDVLSGQYFLQYLYISVGSFSLVTAICACLLIGLSAKMRSTQPFFLALSVGDLSTAICYVIIGAVRLELLNEDIYYILVKPTRCLKMPYVYLYIFGTEFSNLTSLVMAVERLVIAKFPYWYKTNWTSNTSRNLIFMCVGYCIFSIGLAVLAVMDFGSKGTTIPRYCSIVSVYGPLYTPYHYIFCVVVSTVATATCIVAFVVTKSKIAELTAKSGSFAAVLKELKSQLCQSLTTLLLTLVAYLLSLTTNVGFMALSLNLPTFDFNSTGGKLAAGAYCLSCGLTVFILIASDTEIRKEALKRFCVIVKPHQNEVSVLPSTFVVS